MIINHSNAVGIENVISGSGSFTLAGSGTVTLLGAKTYTGATIISSGKLTLTGTTSLASSSGVADNGVFDISGITGSNSTIQALTGGGVVNLGTKQLIISGGAGAFSGSFSGTGSLEISGGTTTFTGTVSNPISVDPGATLQIGNGGTSGAATGAITNNGTLAINRSNGITIATAITGAGGLVQLGGGTLTLTGNNSYSGTTTISSGTLQIGAGGVSGSLGTGNVIDNGVLVLNRSDTVTLAGTISGSGSLIQAGGGTLILNGVNSYTGQTSVSAGILEVGDAAHPGASLAGPVAVAAGATLMGHGAIGGGVAVAPGGALRPGGSIGTLSVAGNVSLPAGSTFVAELSPTVADRLNVGGSATLGGDLQLIANPGAYAAGTDFKLLSAGSVIGTFANVTGPVSGFTNTIQYSATGVDLILSTPPAPPPAPTPTPTPAPTPAPVVTTFLFGSYGNGANQVAAGNALAAGSPSGALYTAMGGLVSRSTASVPAALRQLAGDIRPSLRAAAIEDSRVLRNTLLDHLGGPSDGIAVWGAGFAGQGRMAGNQSNLHHDSAGFVAGVDMPVLSNVRLGVEGGFASNRARTPGRLSIASGDNGHVGGYASWNPGRLHFDLGGDYAFGSDRIQRALPLLGLTATGSQDRQTSQVFADLGYRIWLEGATLEPHAGIAHIVATTGSFAESGGIAALSGKAKSDSASFGSLGLRAGLAEMAMGWGMSLSPRLDLGWQHALAPFTPYQTVSFADAGTSFQVLGTPLVEDAGNVQAGFDLKLGGAATFFISYDGSFSSTVESHAIRGGLNWRF